MDEFDMFDLDDGGYREAAIEMRRMMEEAKKKGAYVFHPDKYLKFVKMEKLAQKLKTADKECEIKCDVGLPLTGGTITIRGCFVCFEFGGYKPFREIIELADSISMYAESDESMFIEITLSGIYTFYISEEDAEGIFNG